MADAITAVTAREILDGRLEPTLRVTVRTADGEERADVPCGRSTGANEARELRDGGDRYRGNGVRTAIANVEERIAPALCGRAVTDQRGIDRLLCDLDGTPDKSELGANAIVGVSLAAVKAGAASRDLPLFRYLGGVSPRRLPVPAFDLIEGGELAASGLSFQEHQLYPVGVDSFAEAVRLSAEVYYELGTILEDRYGSAATTVGDEGGYAPGTMTDPREAFDAILAACEELGYEDDVALGIDAAATHRYDPEAEVYRLGAGAASTDGNRTANPNERGTGERELTRADLIAYYADLVSAYPLRSIEDPLHEGDFAGTAELTRTIGSDVQVIGDDLFATNSQRLARGIDAGAANCLLLKVNQIGTVSEALDAAALARENGYAIQVSERSGQTPDTWLADLAVGLDAGQIKTGVTRGERTEQYNRLLEIEADLGAVATYDGDALAGSAGIG